MESLEGQNPGHMILLAGILASTAIGMPPQSAKTTFAFANHTYVHRYSRGNLHEFTPKNQPNLQKWTDMLTVNDYPDAKDGEALAANANAVLETYKVNKAMIVKTDSVPRTESKPAEHLIVVIFPQKQFIEAAFARFVMNKGTGSSIVYSHRIYGTKAGNAMSKWLKANGEKTEKTLMSMALK